MDEAARGTGRGRAITRALLGAAYFAAGLLHLLNPAPFLGITPAWVPEPALVIALTGLAEVAGAVGEAIDEIRNLSRGLSLPDLERREMRGCFGPSELLAGGEMEDLASEAAVAEESIDVLVAGEAPVA